MARQEEGHCLVAHLFVGHPGPVVFILRHKQHREEVALVLAGTPPLVDDPVNYGVQRIARAVKAPRMRERQFLEPLGEGKKQEIKKLDDRGHRLPDPIGLILDIGAEKRLPDDLERQVHHFLIDVAHLAVTPFPGHPLAVGHHGFGVGGDPLAVKGGLDHPALAKVRLALAGEQALAEKFFGTLKGAAFFELMRVERRKGRGPFPGG